MIHNDWNSVKQHLSRSQIKFSGTFVECASQQQYPADAFSLGQLISKVWLLETLKDIDVNPTRVAVLGAWIGTLAQPMCDLFPGITRIYGIDNDPFSVALSDQFNSFLVSQEWKYKGVVADANLLYLNHLIMDINGTLVEDKPDTVINTSCEHMSTEWYDTVDSDQLIVIQSNNDPQYDGHINTCRDLADFLNKYPMSKLMYAGEMITPAYTRFMSIGYK